MSPATTTAPSAPRRRNSARLDEVRSARRGSRDRLPSPARARTRTRWRARGGGPRPRARTRRARTPGGTPRATTRPRPARRRVSRPTTSRGFRVPSERNTRRGAPARPPPPPRPRRPLRLPPPRRDRTSSPRARTPGRAPLALARDFRGAIRAFRVESFSQATRQVVKSAAPDRPRRPFDRLRPLFFFRASFRFQRKKNAQRKNTFRMHTSPTLLHHRSMAVGASHFFTLFEPAFASGLYLSLPNALARGTPCGTRAGDRRQGERVRRRVHRDTRGESSSGTSVFGAREGGEGSGTGSAMVATRRRATRDASNAKKPLKDVSNGDAATATKLPRKIPGTGPSTAPPAAAVVARNTRSSRKKPVANVGRTRAGPVAHDADASEEATEPVRLEAKFERAAKEEPAKKKRKALETIEIDVNDRAPGPRRVTRARTRKSTTPRLSAFPLCTRRSARGRVRFLPRAVPEPDPPLPPGRPADDGDARHTPAVDLTCDERLVAERGTSTTVPPVLSRRPSRPCFRVFPCTREEFEPTEILNLRARARSRHDR